MWSTNGWFGFTREQIATLQEGIHRVEWDGPSDVKVVNRTPDEIEVRRVDSSGNPMPGDEHSMVFSHGDPVFDQITRSEQDIDDHDAWREKRAAALEGRPYHESINDTMLESLMSMTAKQLKSYLAQLKEQQNTRANATSSMNESTQYLSESVTMHGIYELTPGKKLDAKERAPSHVIAHTRKMSKLGVPVHNKAGYGETISVKVKNTRTGESTHHHVYQRDYSKSEENKRLVTVRPVGGFKSVTETHNEVIKNYLAGKRAPKE